MNVQTHQTEFVNKFMHHSDYLRRCQRLKASSLDSYIYLRCWRYIFISTDTL